MPFLWFGLTDRYSADEPLSNRPKWPNYPYPITAQDAPAAVYALYIAVHHYERAMNQKDGPQDEQLTYKNLQEAMEAAAESTDICPILNHHGNDEIQKELRVRGIPQVYTAEMALRIEGWRAAGKVTQPSSMINCSRTTLTLRSRPS